MEDHVHSLIDSTGLVGGFGCSVWDLLFSVRIETKLRKRFRDACSHLHHWWLAAQATIAVGQHVNKYTTLNHFVVTSVMIRLVSLSAVNKKQNAVW